MRNPRIIFAKISAVAAILLTIGTAAISKTNNPEFSNIKISNFGQMDERFYRGARPKERDFQALKALGINTIIDLTDNTPQEKGFAEAAGLKYVNIAIPDKQDPSDAQIAEFLRLVNDPSTGKFYVHCAGGRHRTGVMGAVYRFNNYRWNFDQVYAEMKNFDFYTSNGHGGQKKFVENYAQRIQSESATRTLAEGSH
ncbi:MAG TPA: tyrosine-protein phosphatase [Pyrinomonadaceae bacterium]|nr:tyrosine-protein phosphatase [Pyrinomonadaceae bacterium]